MKQKNNSKQKRKKNTNHIKIIQVNFWAVEEFTTNNGILSGFPLQYIHIYTHAQRNT